MPRSKSHALFISFASNNSRWKDALESVLLPLLNDEFAIECIDYSRGSELPFGKLKSWISQNVGRASVFLAIVSKEYTHKQATLDEWRIALETMPKGKLIFVPIVIDNKASLWWEARDRAEWREFAGDLDTYVPMFDVVGNPLLKKKEEYTEFDQKVEALATLIRDLLIKSDQSDLGAGEPSRTEKLVILGRPLSKGPDEISRETNELIRALRDIGAASFFSGDEWRINPNTGHLLEPILKNNKTTFVQPVLAVEGRDAARGAFDLHQWLKDIVATDSEDAKKALDFCKMIVWLPQNLRDVVFEEVLGKSSRPNFLLRHDGPAELAGWLKQQLEPARGIKVLTLERMDDESEDKLLEQKRYIDQLHDGFFEVVEDIVKPWPVKTFPNISSDDESLQRQLGKIKEGCAIIAIHDLSTLVVDNWIAAEEQIENRMKAIERTIEKAVLKKEVKVFKSVLLYRQAEHIDWVEYGPGKFKGWTALPFEKKNGSLRPRTAERESVRNILRNWAR